MILILPASIGERLSPLTMMFDRKNTAASLLSKRTGMTEVMPVLLEMGIVDLPIGSVCPHRFAVISFTMASTLRCRRSTAMVTASTVEPVSSAISAYFRFWRRYSARRMSFSLSLA